MYKGWACAFFTFRFHYCPCVAPRHVLSFEGIRYDSINSGG